MTVALSSHRRCEKRLRARKEDYGKSSWRSGEFGGGRAGTFLWEGFGGEAESILKKKWKMENSQNENQNQNELKIRNSP